MEKDDTKEVKKSDEELIDTLIAISVVAKRLAKKLRTNSQIQNTEEKKNESN